MSKEVRDVGFNYDKKNSKVKSKVLNRCSEHHATTKCKKPCPMHMVARVVHKLSTMFDIQRDWNWKYETCDLLTLKV